MREVLIAKFKDKELAKKLCNTGNEELINMNQFRDEYWGVTTRGGRNKLGAMLMERHNSSSIRITHVERRGLFFVF